MPTTLNVLGVEISNLKPHDLIEQAVGFVTSNRAHQIITANALLVLESRETVQLKQACDRALVIGESAGISWAARRLHKTSLDRIAGIDLALKLCERMAALKRSVFLLGGESDTARDAAQFLVEKIPSLKISGFHDGFFTAAQEDRIIKEIADAHPGLVLVALGMPKQDIWIHEHLDRLPPALYIGVGGSFDVWAGNVRRAPKFFQTLGIEWLFRLIQEPWRWKRILLLPRFAALVLAQKHCRI